MHIGIHIGIHIGRVFGFIHVLLCFMRMIVSHERCSLPDYSVSFMSEFHEVKCPEHIGRVAGNG